MTSANAAAIHSPDMPDGKRRLIDAALQLAARGTGFSSMGIRELARIAGLNHNTFYRHFQSPDDLTQAAAEALASQLMAGLKRVRAQAARHGDATRGAVEYFLDFVAKQPATFAAGLHELHGGSPATRRVMQKLIGHIAEESVEQIVSMGLVPGLDSRALLGVTRPVTYYMFYRARDFIDAPAHRKIIADEMVMFIRQHFLGALALQQASARVRPQKSAAITD